jgi:hypothetical protein
MDTNRYPKITVHLDEGNILNILGRASPSTTSVVPGDKHTSIVQESMLRFFFQEVRCARWNSFFRTTWIVAGWVVISHWRMLRHLERERSKHLYQNNCASALLAQLKNRVEDGSPSS